MREQTKTTLPIELWTKIADWVRHPLPPVGQADVAWADLSQQDLTVMMRVCGVINEATAPVLYREIVVDNPAALLMGIDQPFCTQPSSASGSGNGGSTGRSEQPLHKRDLLALVRTAHYVYPMADRDPVPVAAGAKRFFDRDANQALEHFDFDRYLGAEGALACIEMGIDDLFPRLVRRTLCPWSPNLWRQSHYPDSTSLAMPYISGQLECALRARMPLPTPRYACQTEAASGPLAPRYSSASSFNHHTAHSDRLESLAIHGHRLAHRVIYNGLILGIDNRLNVQSVTRCGGNAPPREPLEEILAVACGVLRDIASHVAGHRRSACADQTARIERTLVTIELEPPSGPIPGPADMSNAQREAYWWAKVLKRKILKRPDKLSGSWKERIQVVCADEVEPCRACGRRNPLPEVLDDDAMVYQAVEGQWLDTAWIDEPDPWFDC